MSRTHLTLARHHRGGHHFEDRVHDVLAERAALRGRREGGGSSGASGCRHVLVVVEEPDQAEAALAEAASHLAPGTGRVRAIHVRTWQPPSAQRRAADGAPTTGTHVFRDTAEQAEALMDGVLAQARARGLHAETKILQVPRGLVAATVDCAARAWDAELVILPGRARGQGAARDRDLWRDVANELTGSAGCPVVVIPAGSSGATGLAHVSAA